MLNHCKHTIRIHFKFWVVVHDGAGEVGDRGQTCSWCRSGVGVIPPKEVSLLHQVCSSTLKNHPTPLSYTTFKRAVSYTALLHQNYLAVEKPDILLQDTENQSFDHFFSRKIRKKNMKIMHF